MTETTGLRLLLAAVCAVSLAGCAPVDVAPKATPMVQRMPTADRPVVYIGPRVNGLIFGGPDGLNAVRMEKTPDVVGMSICPGGRLAAVLRRDREKPRLWLTFYDASGWSVGEADFPVQATSRATIWLGPRREAIAVLHPRAWPVPAIKRSSPARLDGPLAPAAPPKYYYANARGLVVAMDVPRFREARFTTSPGFAILTEVGRDEATGWRTWRLARYASPTRKAWEAEMCVLRHPTLLAPSIRPPEEGAEIVLQLGDEGLHFRPDGTHFARAISPGNFSKANPGYVARAGAFYEEKYLPKATGQLAEAAGLTEKEESAARTVLRGYIYDYLTTYTRCNGRMPVEAWQLLLSKTDACMAGVLGDTKYDKYLQWRGDTTGAQNAMAFLLRRPYDVPPEQERRIRLIHPAPDVDR